MTIPFFSCLGCKCQCEPGTVARRWASVNTYTESAACNAPAWQKKKRATANRNRKVVIIKGFKLLLYFCISVLPNHNLKYKKILPLSSPFFLPVLFLLHCN